MASFYGNMKNNSRASFIFDRVYPTRTAMEAALNAVDLDNNPIGDGIFINRYVLVDYHYALTDPVVTLANIDKYYTEVDNSLVTTQNWSTFFLRQVIDDNISYVRPSSFNRNDGTKYYQRKVFLDRFEVDTEISDTELLETTSNLRETDLYYAHRYLDWQTYHASYDCTVWMKIYADNKERYILVAELDAKAPILEFIDDSPNCLNGSGHFDSRVSTDLNYVYFMPSNWNMVLNKYDPNDALLRETTDNFYWHYLDDKESNELWYEDYILSTDTEVQNGKNYYELTFEEYPVEVGSSIKNLHCYIPKYEFLVGLTPGADISSEEYYEYIGGRYIRTEDTVAQGKPYYKKVTEPVALYMAADETIALEDVVYYRITNIRRVTGLLTGENISTYGYYELNDLRKTFNDNVEYPYFNAAGFNPKVSTHVPEKGLGIFIKKVPSTKLYPKHKFVHAGVLTADTYLPNRYYVYTGAKTLVPAGHEYDRDHAYYIRSADSVTYQVVALILNDAGKYIPARNLSTGETYYYDEDLTNPNYFEKSTSWSTGTAYYEITSEVDSNGTRIMEQDDDTYRVDVYLPELGNTVADIYDILYGAPIIQEDKSDGFNNLIGYCSKEQWASYNVVGWCTAEQKDDFGPHVLNGDYGTASDYRFDLTEEEIADLSPVKNEEDGYIYPVYLMDGSGDYWAGNRIFSLTDELFNLLSPEIYPGLYDIPVYLKEGSNVRPYNNERIKSTLTPPYDNLEGENDISLGWSLTLLKRYLSELRLLAYGEDENGHLIGLLTDWTQENDELIGYIQHRPVLITNFTKTSDTLALPNKLYYRELVENGEVVYESLSEHYDLLNGEDYGNLNYYYENRRNIMEKVNNDNCATAINGTLFKIAEIANQESINSTNFLDENVWIKKENTTYYEKATEYYVGYTWYESKPLEISATVNDYAQWYYQRPVIIYSEITENNPLPSDYEGEIYKDNTGIDYLTVDDFLPDVENDIYYYYDFNESGTITGATESITESNKDLVLDIRDIYVDSSNKVSFVGYYYATPGFAYDPITYSNYDITKLMWKEVSGEYSEVVATDYVVADTNKYFYLTEDIHYEKINKDNFARERNKFKLIGTNTYEAVSLDDFFGTISITNNEGSSETVDKYYVLKIVNNQTVYTGINASTKDTIIADNTFTADSNESIFKMPDIYERKAGNIKVNQDLTNLGYTVFELPRTNSNNIEKNRDMYIQCSEYAIFDPNTTYYTYDGSRYVKAVYTIYDYDVEPIAPDYENNGLVQWDYGYQITIDANNTIIERKYSNFNSKSVFDSGNLVNNNVVLYRNQMIDGTLTMKSVHKFTITLNNGNTNADTPEIHADLEDLRNLNRADTLNFLNNTLVNNYGATYTVDEVYLSWPTKEAADNNMDFYYAHLIVNYTNFDLDVDHFNANKTRYFTVEKVPIEQEDYEIHNIWNDVLERVLQEP